MTGPSFQPLRAIGEALAKKGLRRMRPKARWVMVRCSILAAFVVLTLSGGAVQASCPDNSTAATRNAGTTIGSLRNLSDVELGWFLAGYVNGFAASTFVGAPDACIRERMTRCVAGRTLPQLIAIVRQEVANNPREWHASVDRFMLRVLLTC